MYWVSASTDLPELFTSHGMYVQHVTYGVLGTSSKYSSREVRVPEVPRVRSPCPPPSPWVDRSRRGSVDATPRAIKMEMETL